MLVGAMGVAGCSADTSPPEAVGWVDLLERVPDTPETRAEAVWGVDFERARVAAGGGEITSGMTDEEIDDAMHALFVAEVEPLMWPWIVDDLTSDDAVIAARELGFGLAEIDRALTAGGPRWLDVVVGDFDGDTIAAAAQETAWGDDVVVGSSGDFTTYAWGPDLVRVADRDDTRIVIADPDMTAPPTAPPTAPTTPQALANGTGTPTSLDPTRATIDGRVEPERHPTPARPLGYGQRLGVSSDGTLLWALTDATLQSGIDASRGRTASLADDDDYRLAAEVLDGFETYSLTLLSGDIGDERPQPIAGVPMEPDPEPDSLLMPYRVVAFGGGIDDDGPFAALVFVFEDPQDATGSAARLRQRLESGTDRLQLMPWSERFPAADVSADGRAVLAVLRGDRVAYNLNHMFLRQESIFWSE